LASFVAGKLITIKECPTIDVLKQTFHFTIDHQKKQVVNQWLSVHQTHKHIILLAPNTTWESKHWPANNWVDLVKQGANDDFFCQHAQYFLLGYDFGGMAKAFAQACKGIDGTLTCVPRWDLQTIAYLLTKTTLLIAPDTGILHLGDFLDCKTIGIFGPTSKIKHGPFWQKDNIANAFQINCQHYYKKKHGKTQKTIFEQDCMYKLKPEILFKRIYAILQKLVMIRGDL
jgi:ADP-heptose:LPS heptosyltransferase